MTLECLELRHDYGIFGATAYSNCLRSQNVFSTKSASCFIGLLLKHGKKRRLLNNKVIRQSKSPPPRFMHRIVKFLRVTLSVVFRGRLLLALDDSISNKCS